MPEKTYESFYNWSIEQPQEFWKAQAQRLAWHKFPEKILDESGDYPEWFGDGELNLSELCLDKHIADGYGEDTALIYDSPVSQSKAKYSYSELRDLVASFAGGLRELGLEAGDRAVIYMPMIPQAVVAMLACARLGVTHSVVFGGFAAHELAIRIDDCKPKVLITASAGIEIQKIIPYKVLVDAALEEAEFPPEKVVLYNRRLGVEHPERDYDVDFEELLKAEPVGPVMLKSTHPSYILYTSGTTGTPKGVIRDTGGYATVLHFSMQHIYGLKPGEVFWAASDIGWVVGHSYIVYGPLLHRNTTVLFEGKPIRTPDARTFWRMIEEHKVSVMFTAPTAIRAIRKEDPEGEWIKKYDLSSLRFQFLAGERCDASTLEWLRGQLQKPVIDHWWQTESGWPMLANMAGHELMPIKAGSAGRPVCGFAFDILDEEGQVLPANAEGLLSIRTPLPPGCLMGLWESPERFQNSYFSQFEGYYSTGDGAYIDEEGYYFITGRVDDVINVAGHRLSTAEMEEVLAGHPAVAEVAVIGRACELKGQRPMAFVVWQGQEGRAESVLEKELVQLVRAKIGAVASLKEILPVERLPKTRSGKTLRRLLRDLVDQRPYKMPSTIDEPAVIPELQAKIQAYR